MLFMRAACDKEDNEKPPYYFKCFLNGAYREYTINSARITSYNVCYTKLLRGYQKF